MSDEIVEIKNETIVPVNISDKELARIIKEKEEESNAS